jgi:hypothetical protein
LKRYREDKLRDEWRERVVEHETAAAAASESRPPDELPERESEAFAAA